MLEKQSLPLNAPAPKKGRVGLGRWPGWVWAAGWLISGLILAFLYLSQPDTSIPLGPATGETYLKGVNSFVGIRRQGFGPLSSDGASQTVTPGATMRVAVYSYSPLTLQIDIISGKGPLQLTVNGAEAGSVGGSQLAGRYQLRFTPQRPPSDNPELNLRFDAPEPFQLSGLSLELAEQWQPIFSQDSDQLLLWAAILLGLLLLLGIITNRTSVGQGPSSNIARLWARDQARISLGWLALPLVIAVATLLIIRLGLLVSVGPSGEMNAVIFWGWLGGMVYLVVFGLVFGIAGVPVTRGQSLARIFIGWERPLARRYPFGAALVVLTVFNAVLTGLFFGVVALQNYGFDNLARFWDAPEYLVIAHSLYDPKDPLLQQVPFFAAKSTVYWAAHFPLYPVIVRLFAEVFGYIPALFIPNFLLGVGFAVALYRFLKDFGYSRHPLWLAVLALFLPLRWLIYHSTGASEAATLFFLVLAFYQFKRERYWWAGIWGAAVVLTRPNGIFLYLGFGLFLAWQAFEYARSSGETPNEEGSSNRDWLVRWWRGFNWRAALALSPMPLALLAVFGLFAWRYGDFLAYLHIPESVTHVYPVPLLSMDVNVGRSEGDFYYYILEVAGLALLWRSRRFDLFWVGLAFMLPTVFMLHDDILRYSLPAFPFVLLIPFAFALESKLARWLAPLALLGVLIYSWSQLNTNLASLDTWRTMLPILGY